MTQYMFMLFDDESWHDMTEQDWAEGMQAHRAFAEAVEAAGARILDGNALEHTRTATTVRNSGGELKLLNLTNRVQDLLQITKLLTVFESFGNEAEAVKSLK